MRIPLSWIKEYIDLNLQPSEIAKILTMAGLEVDGYETVGGDFSGVIVGRVLETEKHPNADKLVVATVTDGKESYQVVCGAPNCRPGLKTAFAPIGASLTDEGKEFKIKKSKLRGVESSGMLCSGKELHLTSDDDGILELPEHLVEGTLLNELYSDTIFEISLTPNLGHCSSVIGVARELSAATGLPLRYPHLVFQEGEHPIEQSINLQVLAKEDCPRYTCRVIKDIKVGPSPDWLKTKLEKCGLRSVNNVVDVTNYVLMEMGHPLHAFDYDRLNGQQIIVRRAKEGETFETLDGKERVLKESHLMICAGERPVAIAGVMGGSNSEVHDGTCHIVLESAYFDSVSVRKTSKQLGLQTDASKRFERGTDPNQLISVLNRAAMLIQEVAGGTIQIGILDEKAKEFPEATIRCRLNRTNQMLGTILSRGEVETIFKNLGFHYQWDGQDSFFVRVPTYRVDIKEEIDLIEEIARLYGYDHIPRQGGRYLSSQLPPAPIYLFEKEIQSRLIAEGLQEFLTCDLIGPTLLNIVQDHTMPPESVVSVLNPTSIEQSVLRTSLLPGLLQVVKYNVDHQNHQINGFEIGRIHFKEGEQYKEQSVAAIVLSGSSQPAHWNDKPKDYDFYDLKGIVENLLVELGIEEPIFKNIGLDTFHSGRQASVFVGAMEVGTFGEIHPAIRRRLDVSQRILFGEFNLQDLMQVATRLEKVKPLAIYPGSERDWTFTIKDSVPFAAIMEALDEQKSTLLEKVSLLGVYRSDKLSPGYQNITLRFVYRDPSKTVAQEVVEAEHHRLTAKAINKLGDAIKG
ncbi:phenylalanyl-tRNA synthetase beta subunit [Candidatus Protochlamydia naegleriophila]|uniref:Phenylalanine--tRNA ligase beta subunit n=1 Tax=Candidatus Protochlamydia naegleriophila TaxID=389348 RepID=A0A0U5EPT9_9BACT|nr:phenylalanine--tRNA ligase subunit beta [Candidatus Protochlamydia naegleriophila]CUI16051.1 phenylalanyl-tRNA synthetase beta subunit [Candidatus Protochlamydia naegleriophila]